MGDFLRASDLPSSLDLSDAEAKGLISMAEASVRVHCGWHLSPETVTAQVVEPDGPSLFLPTLHLTAVSEVVDNGRTLTVDTDYRWAPYGEIRRRFGWFSCEWRTVTVSYVHGYASGSDELLKLKQVVRAVVTRLSDSPDIRQTGYQVGMITESFAAPPVVPSGLLYSEQADLAAFTLPKVA